MIDKLKAAQLAIELGFDGHDLADIRDACDMLGEDVSIMDDDCNTTPLISEVEDIALSLLPKMPVGNECVEIICTENDQAEYIDGVLHWISSGRPYHYPGFTLAEAKTFVEQSIASR